MVHVPRTLMIGRCVRCGKRVFRGERRFRCPRCGVYVCPLCHKKTQGKCPVCSSKLQEV